MLDVKDYEFSLVVHDKNQLIHVYVVNTVIVA